MYTGRCNVHQTVQCTQDRAMYTGPPLHHQSTTTSSSPLALRPTLGLTTTTTTTTSTLTLSQNLVVCTMHAGRGGCPVQGQVVRPAALQVPPRAPALPGTRAPAVLRRPGRSRSGRLCGRGHGSRRSSGRVCGRGHGGRGGRGQQQCGCSSSGSCRRQHGHGAWCGYVRRGWR